MKKTVIYARQSIDKKDSISIQAQIDLCKSKYPTEDHFLIFKDKGFSGKNTKRPNYQKMMREVEAGNIDKIIVYRLDRLSRSIVDFGQLWSTLEKNKVEFVSISESFDTSTPTGRAMIYIVMTFAQLERETISERVKDNYYERMKYGTWLGGPAPFGFDNGKMITEDGRLVPTLLPNKKIEDAMRIFYSYADDDISLGKLAKMLNQDGVLNTNRKTWDNVAISRILHNPCYVKADSLVYNYYKNKGIKNFANPIECFDGKSSVQVVGKRQGNERKYANFEEHSIYKTNFKGIIPSDIWLKCQEKLERNAQIGNSGKGKHTWLSGTVKCGNCGYALVVKKYKETLSFRCSGHYNVHICNRIGFLITPKEVEEQVSIEIQKIFDSCAKEVEGSLETYQGDLEQKNLLQQIELKIERLLNSLSESSEVTMKYINREIEKLDKQKCELLQSIKTIQKVDLERFKNVRFDLLEFEDKKAVLSQFVEKILIFVDEIEIVWKI
ncbi:MAG: recombinase family protein [Velocimicrobium sp.]